MIRFFGKLLVLVFVSSSIAPALADSNNARMVVRGDTLSAGRDHACAVTSAGEVRCWGDNSNGQTGVPSDLGLVTQVSAGWDYTCALTVAGKVRCWGDNSNGQTGVPSDLGVVTQVTTGWDYTCALTVAGEVRCWGYDWVGQTGVPSDLGVVTQVSAGEYHTCALTFAGEVRCWGDNGNFKTRVPSDLGVVTQVSAGKEGTCVLTVAGEVRCWGYVDEPSDLGVVTQIAVGRGHDGPTCVLTDAGIICRYNFSQQNPPESFKQSSKVDILEASITGSLTLGSVVEAQFDPNRSGTIYYQWYSNGAKIKGATTKSYSITEADIGKYLTVSLFIRGVDRQAYSTAPARFVDLPFVSSSVPLVSGDAEVGGQLTAKTLGWEPHTGISYEWLRNGEKITNATSYWYRVTITDINAYISVRVTGTKANRRAVTLTSSAQRISSLISGSPCPGNLDTTEDWFGTEAQPSIEASSFASVAGRSFQGQNGKWPNGTKFCQFWMADDQIIPYAIHSKYQSKYLDGGKTLRYVVLGIDKKGKRKFRFSNPWYVEYCDDKLITSHPVNSVKGVSTLISGQVKTCDSAKTVQYREKPYGKVWSAWENHPITPQGKYAIKKSFNTNSKYEVRVNNAGTWMSAGDEVKVQIKFALPLSFSWKVARNSQGFNQGGDIFIKFTGDREFNGICTVRAKTDYAFNFAGVAVGDESRFTSFAVRKGNGSGQVTMRWNGKSSVGVGCSDPHFTSIFEVRYVSFKPNF